MRARTSKLASFTVNNICNHVILIYMEGCESPRQSSYDLVSIICRAKGGGPS